MMTRHLRPHYHHIAAHLFLLGLLALAPVQAVEIHIVSPQEEVSREAAELRASIDRGDAARLLLLLKDHPGPGPLSTHFRLNLVVARAHFLLGQPERALPFALDVYGRTKDPEAAWLAAELLYATDDFALGDRIADELRSRAPNHPGVSYLFARRLLCQLSASDADSEWPPLRAQLPAARQATDLTAALVSDGVPGSDPRFLTAGLDLALFELDYPRAAEFSARLTALRPRNPGLARLALACAFPTANRLPALIDQLQTGGTLPADELDFWRQLAARRNAAATPHDAWTTLAAAVANEPKYAVARLVFLERALASAPTPGSGAPSADYLTLLKTYAQLARDTRASAHASRAVALRDSLSISDPALNPLPEDEATAALLRLASRHNRAAKLIGKLRPAHEADFDWLARNRALIARHSSPQAYLDYLLAMETLRPGDPRTLVELARAFDTATDPRALTAYRRAFARCPGEIRPQVKDWFAFVNLLDASAARGEMTHADVALEFDALIERVHETDNTYAVAAHFYADLLDRRAKINGSPELRRAADVARADALSLDPFADDFFRKLGRKTSISIR